MSKQIYLKLPSLWSKIDNTESLKAGDQNQNKNQKICELIYGWSLNVNINSKKLHLTQSTNEIFNLLKTGSINDDIFCQCPLEPISIWEMYFYEPHTDHNWFLLAINSRLSMSKTILAHLQQPI